MKEGQMVFAMLCGEFSTNFWIGEFFKCCTVMKWYWLDVSSLHGSLLYFYVFSLYSVTNLYIRDINLPLLHSCSFLHLHRLCTFYQWYILTYKYFVEIKESTFSGETTLPFLVLFFSLCKGGQLLIKSRPLLEGL